MTYVKKLTEKALNGNMRDMLAFLKEIERLAPEALEEKLFDNEVKVTFVLPDGRTMEDYRELRRLEDEEAKARSARETEKVE